MKFHGQSTRRRRAKRKKNIWLPLLIPAFLITIPLSLYVVNEKLKPVYVQYAEVQTRKIAAHVINKAINSRPEGTIDNSRIITSVSGQDGMVKIDSDIVNQVVAETHALVESHLEQAEAGNLDLLPLQDNIKYDQKEMENHGGIVFFVPLSQALQIPLLGNLGPKVPIRFHVIGDVHAVPETEIRDFGINNAYVEISVLLSVNVQIIVPLATKTSTLEQKIPVAITVIKGDIPVISGGSGNLNPQVEVPIPPEKLE
ncbi:sporulation protein YunB [Sporosarcina sp. HYO08]|uniref:sporulation protein YunB n=1 Tax=Sporosarcina sp. HYO08 TaxID=1759557 RepID=UPI00079554BA|nr:sporulation protein YunB [Sporosarcina sp. HYO08]KXH79237.1 hypothetical protein AU377_11655 [Sporosarcina sp. HYO08]